MGCKAQIISSSQNIIPIEDYITYPYDVPEGYYIKDVNNLFDKYIGTWTGIYDGKNYEFVVTKYTSSFLEIAMDELIIRYKITDASTGNVIIDTTPLLDDSPMMITGSYLDENGETYHLEYMGEDFICGQNGYVLIAVVNNNTQMNLAYAVKGEKTTDCLTGTAEQVLPPFITLTKQ
ncbi:hypothetical protein NHF50_07485 [Flavobacterium sp. NRK F10]|uniref:hypothetical protein n=1 Tax=Flavobacterium TaxID=237 RepID=UPI0011B27EE3|nr:MULTISPECIES: hypothetical protein [Flavobacterium]MCO6174886.1 hypothetical protein [Flavobacterium sp. NRK F10]